MRSVNLSIIMLAISLCSLLFVAQADQDIENSGMISIDCQNLNVSTIAKFVSDVTGENIVLSDEVKGIISWTTDGAKIPTGDLLKAFKEILEENGFTMVRKGETIEIIPAKHTP